IRECVIENVVVAEQGDDVRRLRGPVEDVHTPSHLAKPPLESKTTCGRACDASDIAYDSERTRRTARQTLDLVPYIFRAGSGLLESCPRMRSVIMDSSTFFSQMALDLHAEPTAERTIERITEYAKVATSCDDAGIMLVHARNQIETAAATSQRVGESHNLQIVHDEGPCLDAIEGEAVYRSSDVEADPRWKKWGPAV